MDAHQKVLFVDAATGYYRVTRFPVGEFFGPVDLGLHLAGKHNSLNIGTGLLAGSIFPGSNRLIFTGFSPCWGGFFVSSMGGAGLVFDNLGINMVSVVGRAPTPSLLALNRTHGEQIEVRLQYWTPGVRSPMAIMGKYYMYYGNEFMPPRRLGHINAQRFRDELIMDNLGACRFHRLWAEEMLPEVIGSLYGQRDPFLKSLAITASRINSRNSSIFWESDRAADFVYTALRRQHEVDGNTDTELLDWIDRFEKDKTEAALTYWYEVHKGIHESLRKF